MNHKRAGLPWVFLLAIFAFCGGCRHHNRAMAPPPAPPLYSPSTTGQPPSSEVADNTADAEFVGSHTPIYSEEGLASWYGPPYDKRRGANGAIYDQNALTAAHRTLPLNSLVRVTNVATGQTAIVRVTDRGPFVPNRILDLSLASAKAVGVWRPGVARVRIDVFSAPSPLDSGGRWCVQIGAFKDGHHALELRDHLARAYRTANVIEFPGPTGYWVRIRPLSDDRNRAVEIARNLHPSEGEAYLVRLD